jgi:hypothetical protein
MPARPNAKLALDTCVCRPARVVGLPLSGINQCEVSLLASAAALLPLPSLTAVQEHALSEFPGIGAHTASSAPEAQRGVSSAQDCSVIGFLALLQGMEKYLSAPGTRSSPSGAPVSTPACMPASIAAG